MFKIYDWTGNTIASDKSFETFEDAWDYILGDLTDLLDLHEQDYQEFYVEKSKPAKEYRFLDPNDPRATRD